jgi:hypothetical protein
MSSSKCAALIYYFGSLLEDTALGLEEKDSLRHMLRAYRWTLKVNSDAGASFARQAISLIDASEGILTIRPTLPTPPAARQLSRDSAMGLPAQFPQNLVYATPQAQLAVNPDTVPLYDMSFMEHSEMYDHGNRGWAYNMNAVNGNWETPVSQSQMHEILRAQAEGQAMGWNVTPK